MSPSRHQAPGDLAHRARAVWTVLGRAGRVALVIALLAAAVLLVGFTRLAAVALTNADASRKSHSEDEKEAASKFAANIQNNLAQVDGRSMFFDPPRPRREAPKVADDSASRPPPPPSQYGGPALVGFAHDAAFFADGRKLRLGDESDKTLKIVRMDPPWTATVLWENVEFTISLFDKDKVVFSNHKPGDKPIEGEPAAETTEIDPTLVGPPRPPESAVARTSTDSAADAKGPAIAPPAREEAPSPQTDPTNDGTRS